MPVCSCRCTGPGIYRQRYGAQPELELSRAEEFRDLVEAFVAEQEATHPSRQDAIGVSEEERWADYFRLQVYDRFSLYFCLKDIDAGESDDIGGFRLQPVGPGRVRIDPYPFVSSPARFTLLRRLLPKRRRSLDEFRRELLGTPPARLELAVEAG